MNEPFDLKDFLPLAAADLIPQLLEELKVRVDSLHGPLASVSTRPPKKIDPYMFLYLLLRGHQVKRIAAYFNTTPQTLYNKFGDIIAQCELIRDDKVLMQQDRLIQSGNVRMIIHAGKTRLGQNETMIVKDETEKTDSNEPQKALSLNELTDILVQKLSSVVGLSPEQLKAAINTASGQKDKTTNEDSGRSVPGISSEDGSPTS